MHADCNAAQIAPRNHAMRILAVISVAHLCCTTQIPCSHIHNRPTHTCRLFGCVSRCIRASLLRCVSGKLRTACIAAQPCPKSSHACEQSGGGGRTNNAWSKHRTRRISHACMIPTGCKGMLHVRWRTHTPRQSLNNHTQNAPAC
jgi:hypothetical protein